MTSAQMIRTLEENGFNALQARTLIEVWEQGTEHRDDRLVRLLKETFATKEDFGRLEGKLHTFATKEDLANLRTELFGIRGDLTSEMVGLRGELKSDMASLRGELKSEISNLRTEMFGIRGEFNTKLEQFKSEMIKWMFGLLISQAAFVLGAVLFIVSRLP
jgi:hypothetical protein